MNRFEKDPPGVEYFKKLEAKLQENRESLKISRIPRKTKKSFIELSNEDFCGDYGMCLKFLVDGILINDNFKLIELEERIKELEMKMNDDGDVEEDESDKDIKLLNGKVIKKNR